MILGVGVDMVTISRVESAMVRHGERFLARILSRNELEDAGAMPRAAWVAKRFAVKEAISKALGTGISGPVSFKNISLSHEPTGQPLVAVHGDLRQFFTERGVEKIHVSISDEENLAMAFVVLEGVNP